MTLVFTAAKKAKVMITTKPWLMVELIIGGILFVLVLLVTVVKVSCMATIFVN